MRCVMWFSLVLSGGLPVTVFGSNLNAVQNPVMSVSVTGLHRHFHDVSSSV